MIDIDPFLRTAELATPEQRVLLCYKAADEIERLQAALCSIVGDRSGKWHVVVDIASDVLEKSSDE